MIGTNNQSIKKTYRVVPIEGKSTWRVEELWDGGIVRGPYGSREFAVNSERNIAKEKGFINDLYLQESSEQEKLPADAFIKDSAGNWTCVKACSIDFGNKELIFQEGSKFARGTMYIGIDVPKWLDEHY